VVCCSCLPSANMRQRCLRPLAVGLGSPRITESEEDADAERIISSMRSKIA
ncbi:17549_t:CDS:1, partial [Acaulospora colombiana]